VKQDIVVPPVGESVTQGILAAWLRRDGERVAEGADLFELETDKATMTVPAPAAGVLTITVAPGTEVTIGQVVGNLDADAAPRAAAPAAAPGAAPAPVAPAPIATPAPAAPAPARTAAAPAPAAPAPRPSSPSSASAPISAPSAPISAPSAPRGESRREPLSTLRRRIAARLVEAQHATASLTTFNEVNMQKVTDLRARYRDEFEKAHGVKLGFLSFFIRACCVALGEMPLVNARIEGDEVVYPDAVDLGVAVSTERGLVVPVVRAAQALGIAGIEAAVADLASRARDRKILPDELAGGSFSITNGGVFGSLLSTPLLNYPQSAILGMHSIQRRPIAEPTADGKGEQVVIRPMMYVALTYDHRLIDGREAVTFLKRVKELVEDPWRLFIEA
jgi:2-oxoglutarate dehydrogenase E2 component (dihydrolipoamide succinyltransferase)